MGNMIGPAIFNPTVGSIPGSATSHTADFAVTAGFHDNKGAILDITGSFPNTPGLKAVFARDASFELRVLPPPGKRILWSDSLMAVDKYLSINSNRGTLTGVVKPDGNLQISSEFGNIVEQL